MKNSTTPKKDKSRKPPSPDLPELLAAVLVHPKLPDVLYTTITNELMSMQSDTRMYHDSRVVAACLNLHEQNMVERKGGAR